ncbi:MAG: DNA-binding MarR family transcriptional regulator [Luteibaculaceae bacterium]|jgi:DNA-binding MarR family transcriptional regulator
MEQLNFNLKNTLIPTMSRATKYIGILMAKILERSDVDLTPKQFILLHIVSQKPLAQSELALITERDKGSLTRLIQSVEAKAFITRCVHSSDKRINMVSITNEGRKAMQLALPIVQETFGKLTADITQEEEEVLKRSSNKLISKAIELLECPNNVPS